MCDDFYIKANFEGFDKQTIIQSLTFISTGLIDVLKTGFLVFFFPALVYASQLEMDAIALVMLPPRQLAQQNAKTYKYFASESFAYLRCP